VEAASLGVEAASAGADMASAGVGAASSVVEVAPPSTASSVSEAADTSSEASSKWEYPAWLSSLNLHELVVKCIVPPENGDAFEYAKTLTSLEVLEKLERANFAQQVADAIDAGAKKLMEDKAATGEDLTDRFKSEAFKGEMHFASLSTFFNGLSGIIGDPQMVEGSHEKVRGAWFACVACGTRPTPAHARTPAASIKARTCQRTHLRIACVDSSVQRQCDGQTWAGFGVAAACFGIGVPLFQLLLIVNFRDAIRVSDVTAILKISTLSEAAGALFLHLKPRACFWPIVQWMRMVLLVGLIPLMSGTTARLLSGLLVAIAVLVLQLWCLPYCNALRNVFHAFLDVLLVLAFVSLLIEHHHEDLPSAFQIWIFYGTLFATFGALALVSS
jgi:hypothetical protein